MVVRSVIGLVIISALVFVSKHRVTADVIWIKGQDEPVFGVVESVDAQQVVFQQSTDGKTFKKVTIGQSSVRMLVRNRDEERLALLTSNNWQAWLDYAEELDAQKRDPVARNLAIKLLIVVVANSDDIEQRTVALNGLVALARNDSERDQFEQLRYLETGQSLRRSESTTRIVEHSSQARVAAADLVKRVRLQENVEGKLRDDSPAKPVISSLEDICSWQELLQISKANRIDEQSLKRLVALELKLRMAESGGSLPQREKQWHELAPRIGTSKLTLATVENVTEFDPWATKFANGKWTKR